MLVATSGLRRVHEEGGHWVTEPQLRGARSEDGIRRRLVPGLQEALGAPIRPRSHLRAHAGRGGAAASHSAPLAPARPVSPGSLSPAARLCP